MVLYMVRLGLADNTRGWQLIGLLKGGVAVMFPICEGSGKLRARGASKGRSPQRLWSIARSGGGVIAT